MINKSLIRLISMLLFVLILILTVTSGAGQCIASSVIDVSNLKEEIEEFIEEHKSTTAAVSVAVFQNETTLYEHYYGNENINMGFENSAEIVMEWGSVTKMLVWICVMQLVELGEINLNEDIVLYLPEGFLSNLKYNKPITIMDLMHHSAGWEEQMTDLFLPLETQVGELKDVLKNSLPNQIYEPGTVIAYSNWGAGLAGYIVERVSGMSFSDYVHRHIFEPLGMEHTALLPTLKDNSWVSEQRDSLTCYSTDLKSLGKCRYQIPLYPAGMATGTLKDFVLFGKAMVPKKGEDSKLFKNRETLEKFLTPTCFYHDKNKTPRNAHGLWIDNTKKVAFGHGGNTFGSSANLQFDPITGTGLAVMTNQSGETVYTNGLQEMVFGKYPEPSDEFLDEDISGVYTQSRTIKIGGLRLYNFLLTMPILSRNDNTYYIPIAGMKITPTSSDSFLLDYGQTVDSGFVSKNKDNLPILEVGIQDYLPKNKILYIFEFFLIFILGLALIYSVYSIIRATVQKIRKKSFEQSTSVRVLISIGNLGLFISFLFFLINVFCLEATQKVNLILIFCAIFTVWIFAFLLRLIFIFRKLEKNKLKRRLFNTMLCGVALLLNSFYWQWFKFW